MTKMVTAASLSRKDTVVSLLFIGVLFFVFGFITWVNAILIPYFKIACQLTNFESYLVAFAFYISYLVVSLPSSRLLQVTGFKKGMMIGFMVMSAGAFIFVQAAFTRTYGIFLLGLFAIGCGLAVLQTAANPYITVLGAKERAAQRISIMGVCNKGAGILAPLLFSAVILRSDDGDLFRRIPLMQGAEKDLVLDGMIKRVILPYTCVGAVLFLLGMAIRYSPLPEIDTEQESGELARANSDKTSVLQFPHLVLGALAIFLHVGTQVLAIDTTISYAATMHLQLPEAKVFPSYTLAATIVGYLTAIILIPRYLSQTKAFLGCTVIGGALSLLIPLTHGDVHLLGHRADISLWFLVLLGFANSMIWAGIWPLALEGLGRFTKTGASLMIMGLCGNAILPLLYGWLADRWEPRTAYFILFPCYTYLFFYAIYGHRIRQWSRKRYPNNKGKAITGKGNQRNMITEGRQ